MKEKNPLTNLAIAACVMELNSSVSTEIQLTPTGVFKAQDGRPDGLAGWSITADLAQKIIAKTAGRKNALPIDYEHQTLHAQNNGQPAPAAGWFKDLEWREGVGLFAVNVEWTAAAKAAIDAKEYRYISPVLHFNPTTGEVTNILMAALVNFPALDGMQGLTALATAFFSTQLENPLMDLTELIKLLGLADDADMAAILEAVKELQATAAKASGEVEALKVKTPDPAKYAPVEAMAALQAQLASLTSQINGDKVGALVTAALSDGRLLPAQKAWAEKLGNSDLAALSSYLDTAQPIAALSGTQTRGNAPDGKGKTLTADELAVCKNIGITEAQYLSTNVVQ